MSFPAEIFAQALNGLSYGVLLFLLSVGLTLIFGMLDVVNLAHGSLYMLGAYAGLTIIAPRGQLLAGLAGRAARRGAHRHAHRADLSPAALSPRRRSTRCS